MVSDYITFKKEIFGRIEGNGLETAKKKIYRFDDHGRESTTLRAVRETLFSGADRT